MDHAKVRSLQRGLAVLSALDGTDGLSLHDLHRATGLPKPTLSRLLATLQAEGFVGQRIFDRLWRRTLRGRSRPNIEEKELLLDHSGPIMRHLGRAVGWPSDVAVYRAGAMEIIETTRGVTPLAIGGLTPGARVPVLSSGLGRAWLAWSNAADRERAILASNGPTAPRIAQRTSPGAVELIIAETRLAGYGRRSASFFGRAAQKRGDMGVAAPILGRNRVLGCINVVWSLSAMDEATFVRRHLQPLRAAAAEIGAAARTNELRPAWQTPR
jgi:IclR family mhp operon transcriptional activator